MTKIGEAIHIEPPHTSSLRECVALVAIHSLNPSKTLNPRIAVYGKSYDIIGKK